MWLWTIHASSFVPCCRIARAEVAKRLYASAAFVRTNSGSATPCGFASPSANMAVKCHLITWLLHHGHLKILNNSTHSDFFYFHDAWNVNISLQQLKNASGGGRDIVRSTKSPKYKMITIYSWSNMHRFGWLSKDMITHSWMKSQKVCFRIK